MQQKITQLTDDNYAQALTQPGLLVIDFWAGWCAPCRAMALQFEHAAGLRPQYRFAKVDVDTETRLAAHYEIRSIPTLLVLRDGEPLASRAGVLGAEQLIEALDRIAATPAPASAVATAGRVRAAA